MPNSPKYEFPRQLLESTSEGKRKAIKRNTIKAKRARALATHRLQRSIAARGQNPMALTKTLPRKGGKKRKTRRTKRTRRC